ncbi:MAG: DUF2788 domain-containing protein [Litorivicinus sp.]
MELAQIESLLMYLGITGLVGLMCWIVYDVGTRAGAGKFGLWTMMGVLMAAPLVFVVKTIVVFFLDA